MLNIWRGLRVSALFRHHQVHSIDLIWHFLTEFVIFLISQSSDFWYTRYLRSKYRQKLDLIKQVCCSFLVLLQWTLTSFNLCHQQSWPLQPEYLPISRPQDISSTLLYVISPLIAPSFLSPVAHVHPLTISRVLLSL